MFKKVLQGATKTLSKTVKLVFTLIRSLILSLTYLIDKCIKDAQSSSKQYAVSPSGA